jgi:hypothetical protein
MAEGDLSPSALKAVAEHLGVLREVARRHPALRRSVQPHIEDVRRLATSALFYSFCLRNPKLFRLWGSLLADLAFFFGELSAPHTRFVGALPLEEMIEAESADFRRLDAADVCGRNSLWNRAAERAFEQATRSALLNRSFGVWWFDTGFVYHLTHLTFYLSRWGGTREPFTCQFRTNLERATRWSMAVADADLVAECVVAASYSQPDAGGDDLIDLILARQLDGGAIQRGPSCDHDPVTEFEQFRHTTLVGLWALSQYASDHGVELTLDLEGPDPRLAAREPPAPDAEELRLLDDLVSRYADVTQDHLADAERTLAWQVSRRIQGRGPFRCDQHHLEDLHDGLPDVPAELSLPRALTKTLLELAGGHACGACSSRLLDALRAIAGTGPSGDDQLHRLLGRFLALPLVAN